LLQRLSAAVLPHNAVYSATLSDPMF